VRLPLQWRAAAAILLSAGLRAESRVAMLLIAAWVRDMVVVLLVWSVPHSRAPEHPSQFLRTDGPDTRGRACPVQ
jgi:hypothetical protein